MPPSHYRYGGGVAESLLHPVSAVALLLAVITVLLLPRRYASLPVIGIALLLPGTQLINIGGMHFFLLRLVNMAALARIILFRTKVSGDAHASYMNRIDQAFVACIAAQAIAPCLLFGDVQVAVYEIGYAIDWIGGYYVFRWLIHDQEDAIRVLKYLAVLLIPVTVGMIIEQLQMYNIFSALGGISSLPEVREGKVRSQGVFAHALMAGSFGAALLPLFLLLWLNRRARFIAVLGVAGSSLMVQTSNSSTPLLSYVAGVSALFLFPLRRSMRRVRIALATTLVALHLVMKAPVWFLIARVDLTGGSSSYHRADLVDQFIRHFHDWWLIGTNNNGNWGLDMWDVQNQYVNVGETGGLLALVFFILVIVRSFSQVGKAMAVVQQDRRKQWQLWMLGAAIFANVVGFFGVNYFDQARIGWFLLLAIVSAWTADAMVPASCTEAMAAPAPHNWVPLFKRRQALRGI